MLFYGSYLLPYNSEIKLVHIEEVELELAVIDFPSLGRVDTSEPGPKKTGESGVRPGKESGIRGRRRRREAFRSFTYKKVVILQYENTPLHVEVLHC